MQSGAVWLWRERRGAALGRCRNGGVQIGGESRAAGPAAEPPPRTKSAKSRPEGGWACGPEFSHCLGLPSNTGKLDYPRRKRI